MDAAIRRTAEGGCPLNAVSPAAFLAASLFATPAGGAELAAAVDEVIRNGIVELRVPGATVAVVHRGDVVLSRGYGEVHLGGPAVDAGTTGFRVGSITKLVTATAVMQLVERGRVDLSRDIDTWLDTPVPRSFDQPLTLHHLLTHTAGYDQTDIGDAVRSADKVVPLAALPQQWPVAQTTPPGYAYRYSNYGYALAGLVIEQVSGRRYADYVNRQILQPLGMAHSTVAQPPTPEIRDALATAYHLDGDQLVPLPLDYSHVAPADALITTAADMAAFMLAHLDGGGGLLQPSTTALMHAQHYSGNPSPYGMAYGFQEEVFRGMRVLEHHGGQLGFASWLFLIPERELGVFISQSRREPQLRNRLRDAVLGAIAPDHEYPDAGLKPDPADREHLRRYAGQYRDAAWNRTTFEKSAWWLGAVGAASTVGIADDGALLVDGQRFVKTGPHQFTHERYAVWTKGFRVDETGRVTHQTSGRVVMERVPWYQHKRLLELSQLVTLALSLLLLVAWPLLAHRIGQPLRAADWILIGGAGLWLVALGGFAGALRWAMNQPVQLDYGPTWWIVAVLTLTSAAALSPPLLTAAAWRGWRGGSWTLAQRALAIVFVGLTWIAAVCLFQLNLVGYRLGY